MSRPRWVGAAALLLIGCADLDGPYRCVTDRQCVSEGQQGTCEPEGFCSFPDPSCATWRRFAGLSGALGDVCVGSDGGTGGDAGSPPSLCDGSSFALCDGFEGAALDPRWNLVATAATIQPDPSRAYRGAQSLHIHRDAITVSGTTSHDAIGAAHLASPTLYLRVFWYLAGARPAGFTYPMETQNDNGGIQFNIDGGNVGLNDWFSGGGNRTSTTAMPIDRWVCVEVGIEPSATSGKSDVRLWLDDVEITDARMDVVPVPLTAPHVYLGFATSAVPAMPATDLWADEIVVDGARVGCQR